MKKQTYEEIKKVYGILHQVQDFGVFTSVDSFKKEEEASSSVSSSGSSAVSSGLP